MGISCVTRKTLSGFLLLFLLSISPVLSSSFSPSERVTKPLLDQICSQPSIHRRFCIRRLGSDPRTFTVDLHGLLGLVVNLAESLGQKNQAMMNNLAKSSSTDPTLKAKYESCSSIYGYAINEIEKARKSFRLRDYQQVSKAMFEAFDDSGSCEDQFEGPSNEPPLVLRHNEVFERFCNIARVIGNLLAS